MGIKVEADATELEKSISDLQELYKKCMEKTETQDIKEKGKTAKEITSIEEAYSDIKECLGYLVGETINIMINAKSGYIEVDEEGSKTFNSIHGEISLLESNGRR